MQGKTNRSQFNRHHLKHPNQLDENDSFSNEPYSTCSNRIKNALHVIDNSYNSVSKSSQNKDQKTLQSFDACIANFDTSLIRPIYAENQSLKYTKPSRPRSQILVAQSSSTIDLCDAQKPDVTNYLYRPKYFENQSTVQNAFPRLQNSRRAIRSSSLCVPFDSQDVIHTTHLKAHPKLKIEIEKPSNLIWIKETEDQMRKREMDERLDKLIGYRDPRHRYSSETQQKVDMAGKKSVRRLLKAQLTNDTDDLEPLNGVRTKKFINTHKLNKE